MSGPQVSWVLFRMRETWHLFVILWVMGGNAKAPSPSIPHPATCYTCYNLLGRVLFPFMQIKSILLAAEAQAIIQERQFCDLCDCQGITALLYHSLKCATKLAGCWQEKRLVLSLRELGEKLREVSIQAIYLEPFFEFKGVFFCLFVCLPVVVFVIWYNIEVEKSFICFECIWNISIN